MITLFENFSNAINIKNYIKQEDGIFKIPIFKFEYFDEYFLKNPKYWTPIKYNSLMRFYLYVKLLKYDGDSPTILMYIKALKEKDEKKIEIINKIPNNNHVLNMINKNFKLNYPNYSYDNLQDLKKFISNSEKILNDDNLKAYIDIVYEVSKAALKSERIVKGVVTMLFGEHSEIMYAKSDDDKSGVDLWKIDKKTGIRQSIQVKNITGNVKFEIVGDTINIDNTAIDLHDYNSFSDPHLPYDYIVFYLEKDKKVCVIKSTVINKIIKNSNKRTIKITLSKWAMKEENYNKVVKLINVPQKFLGKDISQIFYTPTESIPEPIIDSSKNQGTFF